MRDPYAYQTRSLDEQGDRIKELLERNGHITNVNFDPVTRVAGALAFHSVVDLNERRVLETNSTATLFRGYEVILKGRDPRDAAFISSRACGVCGGVHSTASALAMEMAFPVAPPPLGIAVRNLMLALEQGLPGFAGLRLVEPEPPPIPSPPPMTNFIPLRQIRPARPMRRPEFKEVARLEALPPGAMTAVDVDGVRVLLANVAGDVYAVRDTYPGSVAPLHLGSFTPPIILCPWHNEAFDIRTGKRVDGSPGAGLDVLPIAVRDGAIKLAVNTLPGEPVSAVHG